MLLRRATPGDLGPLLEMYEQSVRWLADQSRDQWRPDLLDPEMMRAAILASIHLGETWCATDDEDAPLGMITIKPSTPPGLWTPEEEAEPHRYAYLSMVSHRAKGTGLGTDLLDWTATRAAEEGAHWLRGDVWTANHDLREHYLRHGWSLVRVVDHLGRLSGTLIQRPAERIAKPRLVVQP